MISFQLVHHYDCDILVVGAGPGGSALGYHLAAQGIKVIVLEAQTFPRDKVCGDGVSPIAMAELQQLGITNLEAMHQTNEISQVALFLETKKVTIQLAKTPKSPFHARIIPRLSLDQWVYEAAKNKGAIFWENTRLVDFYTNDQLVCATVKQGGQTRVIKAQMIVGADGSNSTVARVFSGKKPSSANQLLGLRAYYQGVQGPNNQVDVYFSKSNFPGIYWMFPVGESGANIGLAMVSQTTPQRENHVQDLLSNHIKTNPCIAERIGNGKLTGKVLGWPLNFYDPQRRIAGNRMLLIGDAAGLINPLSGDGIQYALLSARWASECIGACAQRNNYSPEALHAYQEKINTELAYDFALSNLLIQIGRNKTLMPLWMEVMTILIDRAQSDASYADIIAGIFEGTYPSYKALDAEFILKSLLQGGLHLGNAAFTTILKGPEGWLNAGKTGGKIALELADGIGKHPLEHARWLNQAIKKGAKVGGFVIK